jgi:diguanylate cyclase (GGDEF)-like protein
VASWKFRSVIMDGNLEAGSEHSLERLLYILAALGEMAEQMTTNPNPTSSIRAIMRMAKGAFGIGKGALFLYRGDDHILELVPEGADERQLTLEVPNDARRFFLAEGGFPLTDLDDPHDALREFLKVNAETLALLPRSIWLPLSVNRHFLGLLMLGEKLSREFLSQTELDILILIGRQFAVALHNYSLNVDLKTANMQLGLKVRQLEQLYDISRDISSSLDRTKITRELIVHAIELLDARKGLLLTLSEGGHRLDVAASFGFDEAPSTPLWGARDGWLGSVLTEGVPLFATGDIPAELKASSVVAVPVAYQERVFGVLAIFDKEARSGVEAFGLDDVPLLVNLASQAATAIENARLYELATVDGLTKLFIRRHFEQRLSEELRRAVRYEQRLSLMIMDIDHFKRFNDTYGHAVGDEVLKLVARTIKASVRENLDIPARYGGEELLVLMPETDGEGAWAMAERVREAIEAESLTGPNGEILRVTVSVGVATWPQHARDEDSLLEAADKALYRSKQAGRNRTTVCEDSPVV